jgi:RNA polymerase sigma-70 factor (ECF subfamily)
MLDADPDAALMLAFAQGREDAFVELYRRYRDRIVTFTRRMLGDSAQAEEAAQEVFLKLYRARDGYEPKSRFSTFIYRIATNHCLNLRARVEHRLLDRGRQVDQQASAAARDQHGALVQKQLRQALGTALEQLPGRQRSALLLVHHEGMSYREAAETLEVSEAALKSLIHRAREAMIAQLGPLLAGAGEELDHAL